MFKVKEQNIYCYFNLCSKNIIKIVFITVVINSVLSGSFLGRSENFFRLKYKNMVFIGSNYSQLTTTTSVIKPGLNFGYYRSENLWKRLFINYGALYTSKNIDLLDKKIRSSYEYSYYENCDIDLRFNVLEFNLLAGYSFKINDNIYLSPFVGIGQSVFFKPASEIQRGETFYQDEPVEDYDYHFALTDGPPIIFNSGGINHIGSMLSYKRWFGLCYYTNYSKKLSSAGIGDLVLNEKINSINLIAGFYF